MVIESIDNEKVKVWKKIRTNKYITIYNKFIVEGYHLVQEAQKTGRLLELIVLDGNKVDINDVKINYVSPKIIKEISLLESIPPIMGVVSVSNNHEIGERIVILDDVQDPGNIGTIIRNSVAFGIDTIILSDNSVNQYNDKLVRSSQGMCFHINIIKDDILNVIPDLKEKGITIYGTCLGASTEMKEVNFSKKYAVIFGNEGLGMRDNVKRLCDELVHIKMKKECESLNVGVSSGIILYNLMRD